MEQEEGLLTLKEIISSSKYKSESEANTSSSPLLLYTFLLLILLPISPSPIMLWTWNLMVDQKSKPCIKINIRELNRVPSTELSILYMLNY